MTHIEWLQSLLMEPRPAADRASIEAMIDLLTRLAATATDTPSQNGEYQAWIDERQRELGLGASGTFRYEEKVRRAREDEAVALANQHNRKVKEERRKRAQLAREEWEREAYREHRENEEQERAAGYERLRRLAEEDKERDRQRRAQSEAKKAAEKEREAAEARQLHRVRQQWQTRERQASQQEATQYTVQHLLRGPHGPEPEAEDDDPVWHAANKLGQWLHWRMRGERHGLVKVVRSMQVRRWAEVMMMKEKES